MFGNEYLEEGKLEWKKCELLWIWKRLNEKYVLG